MTETDNALPLSCSSVVEVLMFDCLTRRYAVLDMSHHTVSTLCHALQLNRNKALLAELHSHSALKKLTAQIQSSLLPES